MNRDLKFREITHFIFSESNEIEDIQVDSVSLLPSLQTLDLCSNKFIKILGGTLQAMPRIKRLKLSNNYINEIDRGALDHLEELGKLKKLFPTAHNFR